MNRRSLTISAALLAVVVVVFGIFVFLNRDGSSSRPALPTGPGQAGEARGIIAEIEERSEAATSRPPAAREPELIRDAEETAAEPERRAAAVVTSEPQAAVAEEANDALDEAYERAVELQQAGQLDDAQVLFFFGARQGHARSAFAYAEMNDPNHHSADTSLLAEPDANAAFRYYTMALDGGLADASARLDELHTWVADAAAAGDSEAERLLLQWER